MLALAVGVILAGCAVGPNFHPPQPPAVKSFTSRPLSETASTSGHGGKAQRFVMGGKIAADWWRVFHSPQLNALIERALAQSPTLKGAKARLAQARANLAAANGGLYPQFDAELSATRQKFSGAQFGGLGGASIFNLYGASLNATWNLDIFGGTRRSIEAQAAQVDYQHDQLRATYLTLVGSIVSTAINAASYQAQFNATQTILRAEERAFDLVRAQEKAGAVSRADVLQARAQLAATRTKLAPLRQQLAQSQHQLATLTGTFPGQWQPVQFNIDKLTLPGRLPLVVPSSLVRRRPDIRAAESALHAASASIGIATAKLYPSFSITGSYGSQAPDVGDLFNPVTTIWNIGASLLAPLFHGGALHAQKRAAVAAYKESLANYQQTVLTAFRQVADVLRALENDADGLSAQRSALTAAQNSLDLAQVQYKAGAAGFLTVLTAVQQFQQAQLGYVQTLAQRYQDTARLFNALGGGWWNRKQPAAMQSLPGSVAALPSGGERTMLRADKRR
ncbi:MAG TPA: efflux transporter outer membrane subunit [Gammaproteobacteria bacterium]|jgi:NodT family efflux transporter outer membrane factor (OMF) lipoprotein|nr:efflux transporter outer membrane subunit [Gammaproteobacteria bacterium]